MNCAECRNQMIACAEGLLHREEMLRCQNHLASCGDCRAEYAAITRLQQRLTARGQAAAQVNLTGTVMRRVRQEPKRPERNIIMKTLVKYRWGFGLSSAAIAAVMLVLSLFNIPQTQAAAVEVMTKGAQAVARLTSIHLRGQLRTRPQDNFSHLDASCPFCPIELWKQLTPELKWRAEKPGRVIVMDGQSTVMLIKSVNTGVKLPQRTASAFDTDWLHRLADLSNTITNEVKLAQTRGWKLTLNEETGADGRPKSVVTILAKSGVPDGDYCKNSFFENADTRRIYRFDEQSELLEAVQIYLIRPAGEIQIFDLSQIDYNLPLADRTWTLELPADISWAQLPGNVPILADNGKYAALAAEPAARAFLEACSRQDWLEAEKFMSPIPAQVREYLGGLEIVSIGNAFTSQTYPGRFVPYEIKLNSGRGSETKKGNLAVRKDNPAGRWQVDGGI